MKKVSPRDTLGYAGQIKTSLYSCFKTCPLSFSCELLQLRCKYIQLTEKLGITLSYDHIAKDTAKYNYRTRANNGRS